MNWYFDWVNPYLNSLYNGGYNSLVAWVVYILGGLATALAIAFTIGMVSEGAPAKNIRWVGIGYTGALGFAVVWPFVGIVLAYSVPLVMFGFVIWCWFALIPSKATRIAKKEKKTADLRAQVDEASRSLA